MGENEHIHENCVECLRRDNERLRKKLDEVCAPPETIDDSPTRIKTYEQAMAALRVFWAASDRPWFCRTCMVGRLLPHGMYGFRCLSCASEYSPRQTSAFTQASAGGP